MAKVLPFGRRPSHRPPLHLARAWIAPACLLAFAVWQDIGGDGGDPILDSRRSNAAATPARIIDGTASVIDGDTIEVHGTRIRFHGIDAPESSQLCRDGSGRQYRAGQKAAVALSDKIGRRPVSCTRKDTDTYGRTVAVCQVGGEDVNAWMVRQGWAMAYRQYSDAYVAAEVGARASRVGIWRGECQAPWEWRRKG